GACQCHFFGDCGTHAARCAGNKDRFAFDFHKSSPRGSFPLRPNGSCPLWGRSPAFQLRARRSRRLRLIPASWSPTKRTSANPPAHSASASSFPNRAAERTLEAICPEIGAGRSIDKLRCDANSVTGPAHAAFEHIAHAKFIGDLLHVSSWTP